MKITCRFLVIASFAMLATGVFAQQQQHDAEYIKLVKEAMSPAYQLNDVLGYMPVSSTVPSPLKHFGAVIGVVGTLHYTHEIYGYFEALAAASPRVRVRSIGKTEEGRDMLEVLIADEATLQQLETYRGYLGKLADPRATNDSEAAQIIQKAKPVYYISAGLHSPETGSPEMVMELAYRLAVDESPFIKNIRENVITIITPVSEPDGRDRVVDIYKWRAANNNVTPSLTYWGHYVAHDNNRDGYGLGLNLTRNYLKNYMYWNATVLHDVHESANYFYASTGMGPYNPNYDATVVNDWNKLAHNDVDFITRRDMPGAWTWGFYNGWAASYLFSIANNRNGIGRFYEVLGNSVPDRMDRSLSPSQTRQEWWRMNPPLPVINWGLRDNINYSQTGVLGSLTLMANNKGEFLGNYYYRAKKSVNSGKEKAPHAYIIPKIQNRNLATTRFVNLLRDQGIEVHQTNNAVSWKSAGGKTQTVNGGAYIVRMDQPYRSMIEILLGEQHFPDGYNPPYDDVGWTMSYLYQVASYPIDDPSILKANMSLLSANLKPAGSVDKANSDYYLVNNTTDDEITTFRLQLKDIPMLAAQQAFKSNNRDYAAGSLIIEAKNLSSQNKNALEQKAKDLGINVYGVAQKPSVSTHNLEVPRIALVHTWIPTPQNFGWWHLAFDKLGIPYDYISTQQLATMNPSQYDVLVLPDVRASASTLVQGSSQAGPPVPWKTTPLTPNIGKINSTDDQRRGMGYEGVDNLRKFLERGGVLITDANSSNIPIDLGLTRNVSVVSTNQFLSRGSIFRTEVADAASPIVYGYPDTLAIYFNQTPVLQAVEAGQTGFGGFGSRTPEWVTHEQWNSEYPRVIMRFPKDQNKMLLSGMLRAGNEVAGKPAIIDVPVGKGHVVMFASHPFWRWQTHGSHSLVFNTILHWNDLDAGKKVYPVNK